MKWINHHRAGEEQMAPKGETNRAITKTELEELLLRFRIGKKPLAQLLGWGQTTVMKYLSSGEIADSEYARRLYRLYLHAGEYYELLEQNKERLTKTAYKRSFDAVRAYILSDRLSIAAQYIINLSGGSADAKRIETVLYFSQVVSLGLYKSELFEEDYSPGKDMLPYPSHTKSIETQRDFSFEVPNLELCEQDKEIIKAVYEAFEWYGNRATDAVLMSEYMRLCSSADGKRHRKCAGKELIKKCYAEVFEANHVRSTKDFEAYLHKRMNALRKQSAAGK